MDGTPAAPARTRSWWPLAVAVVAAGQAGLALHLFGPDPLAALTDPRPVVAGRHPLHLYHAGLGSAAFRDHYTTYVFDPAFQAGYPKTPVFDGGCRPAEAVLYLAGGGYRPDAYKWMLFGVCVAAPVVFAVAARAARLSDAGTALAAVGGCLVWWSAPVRTMFDNGNIDLLLAGLMGLVFVGGLVRYAEKPGVLGWVLVSGSAVVGWYAHPILWLGLLPVVAGYYVALAPRNGLAWHLGLLGITAAGLAPNLWWLCDWARFWWLRQPSVDDLAPLPPWDVLLGGTADYTAVLGPGGFGWAVLLLGLVGLVGMVRDGRGAGAGVLLATAGLAVVAARLGQTWPPLQVFGTARTAPFAVGVLTIPAACLLSRWWAGVPVGRAVIAGAVALPAAVGWVGGPFAWAAAGAGLALHPLPLGLTREQEQLTAGLREHTTANARILLEELDPGRAGWNWTALLPVLTDRAYLGGLDPDACVEHSHCGLRNGRLNGRPFAEWTADERADFCRRYNVGWVACRSAAATDWWGRDPHAREVKRFRDGGEVVLFALDRPPAFVLTGSATVERLERGKVVLTDAVPNEAGDLVLSLHHQRGLRAAPVGVWVEGAGDKDLFDPIPLVKLRLPGPVSRVVLTWDAP